MHDQNHDRKCFSRRQVGGEKKSDESPNKVDKGARWKTTVIFLDTDVGVRFFTVACAQLITRMPRVIINSQSLPAQPHSRFAHNGVLSDK